MKWLMALVFATAAYGQQIDLSALDKLAERAKSAINVSLDEEKLKWAAMFLSGEEADQAAVKALIAGLKAINVRVFEFNGANSFASSELDGIKAQLRSPGWSKMVEAKDGDEIAEVYMFTKGKEMGGIAVIAGEKHELSVVNIVGPIDLKNLGALAGKFGIPKDVMGGMGPVSPKQVQPRKPTRPAKD